MVGGFSQGRVNVFRIVFFDTLHARLCHHRRVVRVARVALVVLVAPSLFERDHLSLFERGDFLVVDRALQHTGVIVFEGTALHHGQQHGVTDLFRQIVQH